MADLAAPSRRVRAVETGDETDSETECGEVPLTIAGLRRGNDYTKAISLGRELKEFEEACEKKDRFFYQTKLENCPLGQICLTSTHRGYSKLEYVSQALPPKEIEARGKQLYDTVFKEYVILAIKLIRRRHDEMNKNKDLFATLSKQAADEYSAENAADKELKRKREKAPNGEDEYATEEKQLLKKLEDIKRRRTEEREKAIAEHVAEHEKADLARKAPPPKSPEQMTQDCVDFVEKDTMSGNAASSSTSTTPSSSVGHASTSAESEVDMTSPQETPKKSRKAAEKVADGAKQVASGAKKVTSGAKQLKPPGSAMAIDS